MPSHLYSCLFIFDTILSKVFAYMGGCESSPILNIYMVDAEKLDKYEIVGGMYPSRLLLLVTFTQLTDDIF